jgi:mono/diheme cytochrome c family protein
MSATLHLIHKISVSLFLLSYVIRLIGLLGNIQAIQNLYTKKFMRILVDMVLSSAFLITGIWMMLNIPAGALGTMVLMKVAVVVISVPLAIIGFKKANKLFAILSVLLLLGAYGMGEMAKKRPVVKSNMISNAVDAKELYVAGNCASCHGANGNEPVLAVGAKDLTKSTLSKEETIALITKGKNSMPGYGKTFTPEQLDQLAMYLMELRAK